MGNILGKQKPLREVIRENKRMIKRAIRELDREKLTLEREEKKLVIEIKKNAKAGQMKSVKIMAKDLVRTRQHITKFIEMKSHLQASELKLQTVQSHEALASAMKATAGAMAKMNKITNATSITKMMADFERENQKAEIMQEMMGDAIDDVMEEDGNEEEEALIVNQVLDEIGVTFEGEIPDAPVVGIHGLASDNKTSNGPQKVAAATAAVGGGGEDVDPDVSDLEARLNNLNRT